jgi:hypothetical protein
VDQAFARFNRNMRAWVADRSGRLGCARTAWILIMVELDKSQRSILTLLFILAFVPMTIIALAQIAQFETRRGYIACKKVLVRSLRIIR